MSWLKGTDQTLFSAYLEKHTHEGFYDTRHVSHRSLNIIQKYENMMGPTGGLQGWKL